MSGLTRGACLVCVGAMLCIGLPAVQAPAAEILILAHGIWQFDAGWKTHLESQGHNVTWMEPKGASNAADILAAAEVADVILISEMIDSLDVSYSAGNFILKDSTKPIINWEVYSWDDAQMVKFPATRGPDFGNTARTDCTYPVGDPGPPPTGMYTVQRDIWIKSPSHPMAAGLSGQVNVYTDVYPYSMSYGVVGPQATVIATLDEAGNYPVLFTYDAGTQLFDGSVAAGKRIGIFVGQSGAGVPIGGPSWDYLSPEGISLLDAAIAYALALPEPATPPTAAITGPASGFTCGQGMAPVSLTATTTDGTPNTVTGVEFFDTIASVQTKLGDAAGGGGTWAFSWTTSAATLGTHSITAKATDGGGLTGTSAPIIVKVWIPGDATGNGLVDGLDYNAWQNGYQQPNATFDTGDFDGNGQVDGLDYNVWQNNYNHTAVYQADGFGPMETGSPAPAAAVAAASAPHITAMKLGTRNSERGTQDEQQQNSGGAVASLTLVFDSAVQVGAGAVEVSGMATGQNSGFTQAYDAATKSLVLTWAQPLAADVYSVRVVADFVVGADGGAPLDGEVGDPAAPTLPSGDGAPGGDALLEFAVE